MVRMATLLAFMIVSFLSAQNTMESDLKSALELWNDNEQQKALLQFDKIAIENSKNWLAQYYSAYGNVITAFTLRDKPEELKIYLDKAQIAQDKANLLQPNNAEVMIIQALINTGWILYNPMANGREYSGIVQNMYQKAIFLAPENPRVVLCRAEFLMGMTQYMGGDVKPYCEQFKKAIELFTTFKPESDIHPNWGLERAETNLKKCNQ